jgi:hypothetical protein
LKQQCENLQEQLLSAGMPRIKATRCLLSDLLSALLGAAGGRCAGSDFAELFQMLLLLLLLVVVCMLLLSSVDGLAAAKRCNCSHVSCCRTLQATTWCASSPAAVAAPARLQQQMRCAVSSLTAQLRPWQGSAARRDTMHYMYALVFVDGRFLSRHVRAIQLTAG